MAIRNKTYLQSPISQERYGTEIVVANITATGSESVADKRSLLIFKNCICQRSQHKKSKNEEESDPEFPYQCRMLSHLFQILLY